MSLYVIDFISIKKLFLESKGFAIEKLIGHLNAERDPDHIDFQPVCMPLSEFQPAPNRYDVITAHAFMDLVPLQQTLSDFCAWLEPGGLFYTTINSDGETVLFPPYPHKRGPQKGSGLIINLF
ncbi:MAG: hypothetical protein CVV06_18100 [Gammaproteobacteria bacterium HGW-Gammaproteobacteria-10]|nr:MAG: hypothetical protein CVV06_18100 [Gammaproteobacteria bacterium HGW-Gammaproteobacteria-10]